MDIVLANVGDIAAVLVGNVFRRQSGVIDRAINLNVFLVVTSDSFKEGRTP